tara:strand:- start:61 stop:780 length:720 start_codon:yes stop_codon:yes gene_type:complete
MNSVDNFKGMSQGDTSAKVVLFFDAASSTASGNNYDKITLSVTDGKEKEVMETIAGSLEGSKSGSVAVIADEFGNNYVNGNITAVDTIELNSSATLNQVIQVEDVTADDTLTAAESGKIFVFQDAAAVLTLPDSGGGDIIGTYYTFISNFAATGQEVKCADTANEIIIGSLLVSDTDDATTAGSFTAEVGDAYSSVEFTGATEGELGSVFKLTCYDTDRWYIEGTALQAGGSATPFATS